MKNSLSFSTIMFLRWEFFEVQRIMDDSDVIIVEPNSPSIEIQPPACSFIEGIPRSFENDPGTRFSFGVHNLSRRSVSQPVLNFETPLGNGETELVTCNLSSQAQALISPLKKQGTKRLQSVLDEFYGVYCLISRSPLKHYKNRCYIGYTVDPNRRIRQHNGGREKGGARKTDNRGPWDMVCIIHGFPNSIAALRFEWAWQNPEKSRVIKGLQLKKLRKETPFAYRLRVACHLMNSHPWCRYALTFRWLMHSEELPFSDVLPPKHIRKKYGLVEKMTSSIPEERKNYIERGKCLICRNDISQLSNLVRCLSIRCSTHYHMHCLAEDELKSDPCQLFPLKGHCPKCGKMYLWGDIIREQRIILKIDESKLNSNLKGLVPKIELDFV